MSEEIEVNVLVDGLPVEKEFRTNEKVEEILKSLLSPNERQNWNLWQLALQGKPALDPERTLPDQGVRTEDTLAFTKKDGGGGTSL